MKKLLILSALAMAATVSADLAQSHEVELVTFCGPPVSVPTLPGQFRSSWITQMQQDPAEKLTRLSNRQCYQVEKKLPPHQHEKKGTR